MDVTGVIVILLAALEVHSIIEVIHYKIPTFKSRPRALRVRNKEDMS